VAVNDHPLTVLSPVDVGDAGADWRLRAAPKGRRDVLQADGLGQIPTDVGGHKFEAVGGAVGEPRRDQMEKPAHLLCTLHGCIGPEQGHGVLLDHLASRGAGSPLHIAFSGSIWRGTTSARNWSTSVIGTLLWVCSDDLTRPHGLGASLVFAPCMPRRY